MLLELRAENYAVIDQAIASFGPGLNLLTGETGAGKSILIDALALLLGGKASPDVVRHGAEKAVLGCVFELTPGAAAVLEANGIDAELGRHSAAAGDCGERQGQGVHQQSAGDGWGVAAAGAGAGADPLAGRDAGVVRPGAAADSAGPFWRGGDGAGCCGVCGVAKATRARLEELQSDEQDRLRMAGSVALSEQGDRAGRADGRGRRCAAGGGEAGAGECGEAVCGGDERA